ncbi:PQQ-binding-like beta-propeller repeat protein [Geodermatophilus sp. SYSU D00742]
MTAAAPPRLGNPYVGPVSFGPGDPLYGRDREREDLLDLLIAERIVLLYSPSGAGKTSLIEAALVPALRETSFEVLPTIRVTHALAPDHDIPTPRNRYVMSVLLSLEEGVEPGKQRPVAELATLTLREYLEAHADRDGRPGNEVLVFDQFEEVLTADPTDEPVKHAFFRELGQTLRDRGHWALFSMREDFLAALDPYLKYVPTRFRTTFRLDLLSVSEALEAIRRPAQRMGVDFTEEAAQQLVDDLRTVRVQRPNGITEVLGSYVEPVQLQVACHVLWSMLPPGATEITPADVEALGRVDQALGDYYAERVGTAAERTGVPERVIRDWFEERLITPQGLRSQVLTGPESTAAAGHHLLDELLDAHLVRAETRRQATWYELAHDRLIEPVRRDNAAWRAQHLSSFERAVVLWEQEGRPDRLLLLGADLAAAEQDEAVRTGALTPRQREFLEASRRADEQARRDVETAAALRRSARRLRVAVALVTLLAIAAVLFLVQSRSAQNRAQQERDRAEEQEVATRLLLDAQRNVGVDEGLAGALAAEGAATYPAADLPEYARDVLYRAASSPVSLALRGQRGPSASAAISEDGSVVVVAGAEDVQVWDRLTGQSRARLPLEDGEAVSSLDVTADGRTVVAGTKDGALLAWDVASARPVRWAEGSEWVWRVVRSPLGDRFASVGASTQVQVWGLDGALRLSVADPASSYTNAVAFSPDGSLLATVGSNPEVVLWDAVTGAERARLPLPEEAHQVHFGTDDVSALATVTGKAVTVWDLDRWGERYPPLLTAPNRYYNLDWDLTRALSVDPYGAVGVYDLASGREIASSYLPGASTWGAGFDRDPGRVLVLSSDVDPAFWDLRPAGGSAYVAAADVAGDRAFAAWTDGTVQMWPGEGTDSGGSVVSGIRAEDVYALAADGSGARLAVLTNANDVHVWETSTGTALLTVPAGVDPVWDVDLSPDGAVLVIGDQVGRVSTWDVATGTKLWEKELVATRDRTVRALQMSPDGTSVLVALYPPPPLSTYGVAPDEQPAALVAPLSGDGSPLELHLPRDEPGEVVTAAAFGADGETVVLGTTGGRVAVLDAQSGQAVWPDPPVAHAGEVREVLVDGTDGSVLTLGADYRVVVHDPVDGTRTRQVASRSIPLAAAMTADGDEMVIASDPSGTMVIPLKDAELVRLVSSKVVYDLPPALCEDYGLDADC